MIGNYLRIKVFVQEKETIKTDQLTELSRAPLKGRLLALDWGMRYIGVAVSDELQITSRPVAVIERTGWKKLVKLIIGFLEEFDAVGLVIGLPYNSDGSESEMSQETRRIAQNFSLTLQIPVFLHDERLTTYAARGYMRELGFSEKKMRERVDAEAAAIILSDFFELRNQKLKKAGDSK